MLVGWLVGWLVGGGLGEGEEEEEEDDSDGGKGLGGYAGTLTTQSKGATPPPTNHVFWATPTPFSLPTGLGEQCLPAAQVAHPHAGR